MEIVFARESVLINFIRLIALLVERSGLKSVKIIIRDLILPDLNMLFYEFVCCDQGTAILSTGS